MAKKRRRASRRWLDKVDAGRHPSLRWITLPPEVACFASFAARFWALNLAAN